MSRSTLKKAAQLLGELPYVHLDDPIQRAIVQAQFLNLATHDVQLALLTRALDGNPFPAQAAIKKLKQVAALVNTPTMAPAERYRTERIPDAPVMPKARRTKAGDKAQKGVNAKIAARKKDGLDRRLDELRAEAAQQTLPPEPRELNEQHLWEDGMMDDIDG